MKIDLPSDGLVPQKRAKGKKNALPPLEFLRECFDYNPETGSFTWKVRPLSHFKNERARNIFHARFTETEVGTLRASGCGPVYRVIKFGEQGKRKTFGLHRIAWLMHYGEDPGDLQIDHRDRDGLNNRIANLRLATHSQNHFNRSYKPHSLPKGVQRSANGKKFIAHIKHLQKMRHIGVFDTAEEASQAYQAELVKAAGEFANLD